jgi:hypothetical protein
MVEQYNELLSGTVWPKLPIDKTIYGNLLTIKVQVHKTHGTWGQVNLG